MGRQTKQGKLVYGVQLPIGRNLRSYVVLSYCSTPFWGRGDLFLYRYLREEKRLCYFIESQVDPLLGKGYVLVSVEREDIIGPWKRLLEA